MLSSLRVLAWRVVDQGRRTLLQQGFVSGGALQPAGVPQQNAGLFRYLQQQQALKKSIPSGGRPRGRGGGPPPSANGGPFQPSNGPLVGLLGRLGPLFSGAVRRLSLASTRRGNRRSLYRDSAPLFAFVGVSLLGFEEEENEEGSSPSRKLQGFVTRQEELEAVCGTIREAVGRSGWLHDAHASPSGSSSDLSEEGAHIYSLKDLELAGVIDKGCNAVVYAAKWKKQVPPPNENESINIPEENQASAVATADNDATPALPRDANGNNSSGDLADLTDTNANENNASATINDWRNNETPIFNSINSSLINLYDGSSSNVNVDNQLLSSLSISNQGLSGISVLPFHGSTMSLGRQNISPSESSYAARRLFDPVDNSSDSDDDIHDQQEARNDNSQRFSSHAQELLFRNEGRVHRNSLTEDVSKLLSNGGFGPQSALRSRGATPTRRTVRFAPGTASNSGRPPRSTDLGAVEEGQYRPPPAEQYPLAVKLLFNYEAASNAPAIVSALYRELIPARRLQLDDTYEAWRQDFFGESSQSALPPHPCVVEMPCAFVDRVPLLPGGVQLYPTALPPRLHPEGFGRNMSLFCVMRRYDMSLAAYLREAGPELSRRTSLLIFTQLLEALQHLHRYNIAHRDLKPDNLLISVTGGADWASPQLVVTDLGCCLAAQSPGGLSVPFITREAEPRQGNTALMAPEVKTARPSLLTRIDFSSCDLWAAGALAYQIYGLPNPFLSADNGPASLDSGSYRESQLAGLGRTAAPPAVRRLVTDMLRRRPRQRPSPTVAATLCQLALWAPSSWLNRHSLVKPSHNQVMEWMLCLTTKVLYERKEEAGPCDTEYRVVSTLLARVKYSDVCDAIAWNRAF